MTKNFKFPLFLSVFAILCFQLLSCAVHQSVISDSQSPNNITLNASPEKNINTNVNTSKKSDPILERIKSELEKNKLELEKNKKLWQEKNITNYNLTASLFKGGNYRWAEPVLIKVRNGQSISIESLDEKFKDYPIEEIEEAMEGYKEVNTIEKMFDYIQKGLDAEGFVSVKYDKNFGYTKDMAVDFYKGRTDTGQRMVIKKFEVIK